MQQWDPWVKVQTELVPVQRAPMTLSGPPLLPTTVVPESVDPKKAVRALLVGLAFAGIAGYHGYKRNDSALWGLAWAVGGFVCPVVTLPFAFSQGFGKKG